MPLLLETIKVEKAKAAHIDYHQRRFDKSRKELFASTDPIDLPALIFPPSDMLYRCRILYDSKIHSIEYLPYTPKEIQHIKIVSSDLSYDYKFAERSSLDALLQQAKGYDEILIEKEGLLTDTSIANIAFYDGIQWFTPYTPLLEGTTRARLVDEGFLTKREIRKKDIGNYTHVALMNAMVGFKILNHVDIN